MKRIFIALKVIPEPSLIEIYSSFKSILRDERITWVDPMNIHLTLAFLGDTEEERIEIAAVMLKQKCNGFGEFDFQLSGTDVFKNLRDPRVIVIGIKEFDRLRVLNELVKTGLKDTGFKIEERPFKPHITIGRIKYLKNHEDLKLTVEKYHDTPVQKVTTREVILYESILKPTGPIYKPLGIFRLK